MLRLQLAINPKNASALRSLGDVLRLQAQLLSGPARSSKLNEAQEMYEAFLKIDPNNASALFHLGVVLRLELDIKPNNASALFYLGDVLKEHALQLSGDTQLAKFKEAQETYEAVRKIDPNGSGPALCSLEDVLRLQLDIKPNNASALCSLGDVLKEQAFLLSGPARSSKLNEAQETYEASLKIEPNNAFALRSLAYVLRFQAIPLSGNARSSKLNEVQNKNQEALKIDPNIARKFPFWHCSLD